MIKGIIIDFNGTMYLDHDLNDKAWSKAFDKVKDNTSNITFEELFNKNIEILTKDYDFSKCILETFNKDNSLENIITLSEYKENYYINLAKSLKRTQLMKGLDKFLDYVKQNNIPICIASMAPKMNFDFYLDYLGLNRWFTYENIVYDSDKYSNKNDQYLEAAKRMNINIDECLLIEDSPKVIDRSINIGIKNVIYLNSKSKIYHIDEIIQEIKDFDEFDYNILKNNI